MKRLFRDFHDFLLLIAISITATALLTHRYGWSLYLERLSHFQVQYFVITLAIALIILLLKRFRSLLIVIFCSAILSAQIIPWYVPPSYPHQHTGKYRIVVSNVNRGNFNERPTLAFIEAEQPDIVLLIEVHRNMADKFRVLNQTMPYVVEQLTADSFYMFLFSKHPLTDPQVIQFGHRDNHESIVATTKINEQSLSLVAIHPVSPKGSQMFAARNTLFSDVTSYVKAQTNPVVMIGDFNTTMWSPYYQQIIHQTNLKNVRKGFGIEPTWPKNQPSLPQWRQLLLMLFQIPIDHCLVSPDIQVADMRAGTNTESDHAPIVVDLAL